MNSSHRGWRPLRLSMALLLIALTISLAPPPAQAQGDAVYFRETGHYLKGAFRQYWDRNGGLALFGYPITEEYIRRSDGKLVQIFERARFELVTGGANPVVELGRIGVEATGNRIFPQIPPFAVPAGRRYFPETLHTLMGLFRETWETRGGARIFGLPISEEIYERLDDNQFRLVQYFERARFELYPEGVRFGRLGTFIAPPQLLDPWPPGVMPPGPLDEDGNPRPPPVPGMPNFGKATVKVNPFAGKPGTNFTILGEGFVPGEPVIFWLTRPDNTVEPLDQSISADGNGSISQAKYGFDTGKKDQEGVWYLSAQGLRSGRIGIISFILNSDVQPGPGNPTGSATVRVNPGQGDGNTVFRLSGEGFRARENVSVWLTAPDGSVRAVSTAIRADRDGKVNDDGFPFSLGSGALGGTWSITAQGQASGFRGIATFTVSGRSANPAPPSGGTQPPANTPLNNLIHEALGIRNGVSPVIPLAAVPGSAFRYVQGGFAANEPVRVVLNGPNGISEEANVSGSRADGAGTLNVVFRPRGQAEGDWSLRAEGTASRRVFVARFKLTRDYVAPLGTGRPASTNGAVNPPEGGRSVVFRLSGSGFRPNEPLDHWITSPDGIYYLVGRTFADGSGRVGVSNALTVQFSERNPTGVYGYHYLGTQSRVRVDLFMTFTNAP